MAKVAMTLAVPDLTGASRMLFYFANALKQRGHEVVVLHGPEPKDRYGRPATIVTELQECHIATACCPLLRRPLPPFVYSQVEAALDQCDAVIGVNQRDRAVALAVAARRDIPGILAIQNQHNFWGPLFIPRLKRYYYAKSLRERAARLICTSPTVVDEVVEFGVNPEKCSLLRNGIAVREVVTEAEKSAARQKLSVADDARIYVNVGRLDIQKGQDLLIESWARREQPAENHQLWLVGDVTEGNQASRSANFKAQLQKQVHDLGVASSVQFLGWRDDVPEILAAADYYVHSARWEGYPLAVMEATAASLPVIMTDCSGHPDQFENGTQGYVVKAGKIYTEGESLGLIRAIESFQVMDADDRKKMGAAARKYCEENFDIQVVGRRFAEIVETEIANWRS